MNSNQLNEFRLKVVQISKELHCKEEERLDKLFHEVSFQINQLIESNAKEGLTSVNIPPDMVSDKLIGKIRTHYINGGFDVDVSRGKTITIRWSIK